MFLANGGEPFVPTEVMLLRGNIAQSAPVNSGAPVVTGTAGVGNTLSTTNGTWTGTVTSYSRQWYSNTTASTVGGTPLAGDFDPTLYEDGTLAGKYLYCGVIAHNWGKASPEVFSNIIGPIAAASGLSSTNATLTSAAGAPVKVQLTFGSDIYAGYYLHIQRTTTAGNYTSPTMDITHSVTAQELGQTINTTGNTTSGSNQLTSVANVTNVIAGWAVTGTGIPANTTVSSIAGNTITLSANATATATGVAITLQEPGHIPDADLTPDGYSVPSGSGAQRYRWEREDGVTGPWSEVTYNVTASVATWNATSGVNSSTKITLNSPTNLQMASNGAGGGLAGARSSPAPSTTKPHFEVTINAMCAGSTFNIAAGFIGGIQDLTNGNMLTPGGAVLNTTGNTTSGSNQVTSLGSTTNVAVGQVITGTGIPAGTTITAIAGTTITLSQNATATATGVAVSIQTAQGACVIATGNSTTLHVYYNGANHGVPLSPAVLPAVGDIIVCEADTVANTVTFWYIPVGTGTPQQILTTTTLTSDIPATWYGFGGVFKNNTNGTDTLTANFGGSAFAKTPTTGYSGW